MNFLWIVYTEPDEPNIVKTDDKEIIIESENPKWIGKNILKVLKYKDVNKLMAIGPTK